MTRNIEEIRAELAAAELAERDQAKARKEAVTVGWKFTLTPAEEGRSFDEIYDDTCRIYRLFGEVTNREQAEAAGCDNIQDGGMSYLFNTLSGKLVMSVSGGKIYITDAHYGQTKDDSHIVAMNELNVFLVANPEGGDVTEIIERHRARRAATNKKH